MHRALTSYLSILSYNACEVLINRRSCVLVSPIAVLVVIVWLLGTGESQSDWESADRLTASESELEQQKDFSKLWKQWSKAKKVLFHFIFCVFYAHSVWSLVLWLCVWPGTGGWVRWLVGSKIDCFVRRRQLNIFGCWHEIDGWIETGRRKMTR